MVDENTTSILIVDDLPEKILVYRSVLEDQDLSIVTAASGAEALKQVLRNDFAVILLDVNMPDMDGFETARLIRQRRLSAHIPIIFLTAFADEVRTAEGYATGGVDYLPTPVIPEILRAKVRVFVDLYRMRQQVAHQAEEQARRAAAEDAARRSEFLAEASRAVSGSLDVETTLAGLARLTVPLLADLAVTSLVTPRGECGRTQWTWCGPDAKEGELTTPIGPHGRLGEAIGHVASTGKAEHLADFDEPATSYFPTGEQSDPGPVFALSGALVVPLVARGETIGVLVLGHGPASRVFDPQDVAMIEDLAARAGIALDNALLVRDIRDNDLRKDEFLAMLAHELRNPLAPIRTGLDLLDAAGAEDAVVAPMRRQVEHMVRLVDDLLDVSRITCGTIDLQRQITDVRRAAAVAVETSRPLIEAHEHALHVSLPDEPLVVEGDPVRLTQVLTNLLNNAAKYTSNGGHVSLSAEREGGDVVIHICDTGAGVSREMLPRIFELFVQADRSLDRAKGGLGIGLTLVRRLVEMHNGSVHAFSEGLGLGSEFVVRLPASEKPLEVVRNGQPRRPAATDRIPCRILVVDDNVDAATTLGMLLRLDGHEIRFAYDGLAALDAAAEFSPEVVLLDIGLPKLDGYEVAKRLRARTETEGAVLIAVSGYGQEEDRRRSREAGFDHHLTKPVDFAVLRQVLPQACSAVSNSAR
ncbi:MAG: response regulator [Planctomycetota bacterium]|nr:response regulator [Planctomycetaceae bacterium]MDQ3330274.1 response regulator [Planctomycetota bacterium]